MAGVGSVDRWELVAFARPCPFKQLREPSLARPGPARLGLQPGRESAWGVAQAKPARHAKYRCLPVRMHCTQHFSTFVVRHYHSRGTDAARAQPAALPVVMYLMYHTSEDGTRNYTLKVRVAGMVWSLGCPKIWAAPAVAWRDGMPAHLPTPGLALGPPSPLPQKVGPNGNPTLSAHPARFSPDDKFSRERVTTKRRFNLLPTQHPAPTF